MQTVKDRFGNSWTFQITLGRCCDELKSELKVNLLSPSDSTVEIDSMLRDIGKAMDAMWILIRKDIIDKEVSTSDTDGNPQKVTIKQASDWFDLFDPPTLRRAMDALQEEVLFFIQSLDPMSLKPVEKGLKRAEELRKKQLDKISEAMDSPEIEAMASDELDRLLQEGMQRLKQEMANIREKNSSTGMPGS